MKMAQSNPPALVRLSEGVGPLLNSEEDPARLWAEIHRLRAAVQGPDGYATWQDAATAERVRRVKAEKAQANVQVLVLTAVHHAVEACAAATRPAPRDCALREQDTPCQRGHGSGVFCGRRGKGRDLGRTPHTNMRIEDAQKG
jgi:hypothetical protein